MKKLIALLLALCMMLGMVACGGGSEGSTAEASSAAAAVVDTTEQETDVVVNAGETEDTAEAGQPVQRDHAYGEVIIGTTEAGKTATELEIPWEIGGVKVTELGSNAFDGCSKLTTIHIQGNLERILNNAFDGAPALASIQVHTEGFNILVPGKDLFENVPNRCKVQVTKEYYGSFIADYFWGNYRDRIQRID